jgi:ribosomal-protein-alanine N-acetyltransferase
MAEITFDLMQDWHLPAVFELEQKLFSGEEWSLEQFESELELVPESRMYWVARLEGVVVGYFGLILIDDFADVGTIAVVPEIRRQGVASKMIEMMLVEARRRGMKRMLLEVRTTNDAAIALYKSFGFEIIAERPNYYGPGLSAFLMERKDLDNE